MKKIKFPFKIENKIHAGAKDLELSLLVKEVYIQQLKLKVKELEAEIEKLNIIINSVIEKLENSNIDLDDKFIWDDRDYSTYELEDLIKLLKVDDKE